MNSSASYLLTARYRFSSCDGEMALFGDWLVRTSIFDAGNIALNIALSPAAAAFTKLGSSGQVGPVARALWVQEVVYARYAEATQFGSNFVNAQPAVAWREILHSWSPSAASNTLEMPDHHFAATA